MPLTFYSILKSNLDMDVDVNIFNMFKFSTTFKHHA
jgi:hypothetical protein